MRELLASRAARGNFRVMVISDRMGSDRYQNAYNPLTISLAISFGENIFLVTCGNPIDRGCPEKWFNIVSDKLISIELIDKKQRGTLFQTFALQAAIDSQ